MPEFDSTTEYRPIPNFPGYIAGNDGTIWTCRERGGPRQWRLGSSWKPMRLTVGPAGYKRIRVTDATAKCRCRFVHLLVLYAFKGPCPEGLQGRHLNGNRLDCRADNLAWGTVQENHDDKQRHGTTARGERDGNSKLTETDVREIRRLASQGVFLKEIARRFDISDINATCVVRGDTWAHIEGADPTIGVGRVTGERHPNSKLTADIVVEIRRLAASGVFHRVIAKTFGVTQGTISGIVSRQRWAHVA